VYVVVASCYSQILWIVQTMRDYGVTYKSVPLICDSSSAICLAHNPVFHMRAKYIKVRHHFLRDHIEKGEMEMKFIDTERQLAEVFTKPLNSSRFASLWGWCLPSLWLGLRGACDLPCIFVSLCFSLAFSSYSPKSSCFTCYTSLYLLN
jgi:hypothetical protein